ncbi:hypothetical protein [Micromonospora sp. CPCC 205556]|uniref:hypothetical protein n=1 Tax=Micromonospora sp. CPCC 205556 TaxID=3122398 RepID=UPI002FF28BFD
MTLRIAGVRLATRARSAVADLSRRLADPRRRLDELRVGELDLRAALRPSVDQLSSAAARAFRLLALAPARPLALGAAAALLDRPPAVAEDELLRLVDVSLVGTAGPGRFQLHELIRAYGRELAERHESARERAAALARLAASSGARPRSTCGGRMWRPERWSRSAECAGAGSPLYDDRRLRAGVRSAFRAPPTAGGDRCAR